ncbi:tripartite tricarboxylate transporter TctB family protein [Microbacterium karelineae]|uniref:tripartite tricarboxylate transporter TctB family protein n=1 Tax=Microbacterium karelineae TaxID=2654283 RepID=UPI0012E9D6A7|nr:tripartite tricarboxylate transporter TctB family protein [Microbacterium karelineae]
MSPAQHDAGASLTTDPPATGEAVPPRPSKGLEVAFAAALVAFFAGYLALATQIDLRSEASSGAIDARTWPVVLGTAGVAAGVVHLVISLTRPAPTRADLESVSRGGPVRVIATVAITAGFIALWSLGSIIAFGYRIEVFPVATAIYMVALLLLFGQRRIVGLVVYPIALTGFVYAVFGLALRIPL